MGLNVRHARMMSCTVYLILSAYATLIGWSCKQLLHLAAGTRAILARSCLTMSLSRTNLITSVLSCRIYSFRCYPSKLLGPLKWESLFLACLAQRMAAHRVPSI